VRRALRIPESFAEPVERGHLWWTVRVYRLLGGKNCNHALSVRRERRWTTAGATPARELVRSTRQQSRRQRRQQSCRSSRSKGSHGDSASVQAVTCHLGPKRPAKTHENLTSIGQNNGRWEW
jgi:hypothetical protein